MDSRFRGNDMLGAHSGTEQCSVPTLVKYFLNYPQNKSYKKGRIRQSGNASP